MLGVVLHYLEARQGMPARHWANRLKLQHLRAVLAVSRNPSLGRAAAELGLTQSAITKILHEVERELGVQLFVRTSRGTHCTEYGTMLADHARAAFASIDRGVQEIGDAREGLSGHVQVGTLITAAAAILPRALAELQRQRPGVRVTLVEGTYDHLVPMLRRGALDFIAGRLPEYRYREGLELELLYQEQVALAVRPGHPVLRLVRPDFGALLDWPWILPPPGTSFRQTLESAFHKRGLQLPDAPCESLSVLSNRRLLLETDCICPFPWRVIRSEVERGLLAQIRTLSTLSFGPIGISLRRAAPRARAVQDLVACLRRAAREEKS